jgi:hypothetical protein
MRVHARLKSAHLGRSRCLCRISGLDTQVVTLDDLIGAEGSLSHARHQGQRLQVLLIGKDGHSTLQWSKPVSSEVLYSVIDRMPMRGDEMRRQQKG